MIIYKRLNTTGYEFVNGVTYEDGQVFADFDGTSRKEGWVPPLVERGRATKRSSNKPADLPYAHGAFLLRRSAVEALKDVLEAHGELLPVATEDGVELFVHNVLGTRNVLDMERTEMHHVEGTSIVYVRTPVFIESAIGDIEIFRVPEEPRRVFYTDRFVARVKAAKLKGTDFTPLWSSTDGPIG